MLIKFTVTTFLWSTLVYANAADVFSQAIPNDAVHLPQKIGGSKSGLSKVDSITISGKVTLSGIPPGEVPPAVYISVFKFGRPVGRRQASQSGSYTLNDVPREGSTIVVEIENIEVANSQIMPGPGDVVFRDFSVDWKQIPRKNTVVGVVSAKDIYVRSKENQEKFESAVEKLNSNKPETSIGLLKSITDLDEADFQAWTELGNAYLIASEAVEAGKAFEAALKAKPDYFAAKLGNGRALAAQQNYDKAIEVLSSAAAAEPTSADAQHYAGEAYLMAKKGSKAVPYLYEALKLAPIRKAEIHLQLAALYNGAGVKDRAALEYKEFLVKLPNYEKRKDLQRYIDENLKAK